MISLALSVSCAAALLLASASARSAQWTLDRSLALTVDRDTNRRLDFVGAETSAGGYLTASAAVERRTERSSASVRPTIYVRRYVEGNVQPSNDWDLTLLGRIEHPVSWWSGRIDYSRDSTLVADLGSTGFVDRAASRDAARASLQTGRLFGPRLSLQARADLTDVRYPDGARSGLVDYRFDSASLLLERRSTERLRLGLQVFASRLDGPAVVRATDTAGLLLSADVQWDARTSAAAALGANRSTVDGSSRSGLQYSLELRRAGDRGGFGLRVKQESAPSGRGALDRRLDVAAFASYPLTEAFIVNLTALHARLDDVFLERVDASRDLQSLQAGFEWRVTSTTALSFEASHANQSIDALDAGASGLRLALTISWAPQREVL